MLTNLKISKNNITEGDLVTLSEEWHAGGSRRNPLDDVGKAYVSGDPYIGIVTDIRAPAGMYDGHRYAKVLWENNTCKEHYIRDLTKVHKQ